MHFLIYKAFKKYLDYKFSSNQNLLKDKSDVHYFKFPYIGNLSHHIKHKLLKLCREYCKENFNFKLVINSFKIKDYFLYKDPIPKDLKSFLVYKVTCSSCISSYIGKTHIILIYLNIYTPPQDDLTHIILFVLK